MNGLLQLFSQKPSEELFQSVAEAFGGNNFETQFTFNVYDMEKLDTVNRMREYIPMFETLYLPCKRKVYIVADKWCGKSCINIVRHFSKLKGGTLSYVEKLKNGVKHIQYTYYPPLADPNKPAIITFD